MSLLGNVNPRDVRPALDNPLNRLFFAINHYVSTGDHIGEGIAFDEGNRVRVVIPVYQREEDQRNFAAFRSRFEELAGTYDTVLRSMGNHGGAEGWSFAIDAAQMDALAADLRERPGALGWGDGKKVIDAHMWEGDTVTLHTLPITPSTVFTVGEPFVAPASFGEANTAVIVGESFNVVAWAQTYESEIEDWTNGPIEYGIYAAYGIPFISFMIGKRWQIATDFNFLMEPEDKVNTFRDGTSTTVTLVLVDYPSNIVQGLRTITVHPAFMSFLRHTVNEQRERYSSSASVKVTADAMWLETDDWNMLWNVFTLMKYRV